MQLVLPQWQDDRLGQLLIGAFAGQQLQQSTASETCLLLEGGSEAAGATRAERELLPRGKPRDGGGNLRHGQAQPLAVLLRREDRHLKYRRPLDQAQRVLHYAVLFKDSRPARASDDEIVSA